MPDNNNQNQLPNIISPNPAATASPGQPVVPGSPVIPPQITNTNPNSTQNSLLVGEIRDGIVIMNDGTYRAVIMCRSINFDLMSPQEREAVEFSYQGFLNSLYFPVQIFIRSQKVDIRPYLEKLEKLRSGMSNMLLGMLMEDYVDFLAEVASQTNIMDKKFYVVISYPDSGETPRKALAQSTSFFTSLAGLFRPKKEPHVVIDTPTLEKAKTELRNRVEACMQGLLQCGVQSVPLDTQELIELFYDAYNPDTATRQQLRDFNELAAPTISRAPAPPATQGAG